VIESGKTEKREEQVEMEWQANWEGPLQSYLQRFDGLLGDARTRRTFQASIQGIMAAGTLICQRIAACSPLPRDTQRDIIKQAVKQKVAFGEEEVIVWHTESMLR
jgi:hypothetical protein